MKKSTISKNKEKKQIIVTDVTAKVQKAKSMVFTNYQGLTHQQMETFRRNIKKMDAEYVVVKNKLLIRSLEEHNLKDDDKKKFEQPTATLFMYNDPINPLKSLSKTIKELKLPLIKFGIFEGRLIDASSVERLASLPPLEVLRAQLLGQMQSPIAGLHRALNWNLQKLVLTLSAIKEKRA